MADFRLYSIYTTVLIILLSVSVHGGALNRGQCESPNLAARAATRQVLLGLSPIQELSYSLQHRVTHASDKGNEVSNSPSTMRPLQAGRGSFDITISTTYNAGTGEEAGDGVCVEFVLAAYKTSEEVSPNRVDTVVDCQIVSLGAAKSSSGVRFQFTGDEINNLVGGYPNDGARYYVLARTDNAICPPSNVMWTNQCTMQSFGLWQPSVPEVAGDVKTFNSAPLILLNTQKEVCERGVGYVPLVLIFFFFVGAIVAIYFICTKCMKCNCIAHKAVPRKVKPAKPKEGTLEPIAPLAASGTHDLKKDGEPQSPSAEEKGKAPIETPGRPDDDK